MIVDAQVSVIRNKIQNFELSQISGLGAVAPTNMFSGFRAIIGKT